MGRVGRGRFVMSDKEDSFLRVYRYVKKWTDSRVSRRARLTYPTVPEEMPRDTSQVGKSSRTSPRVLWGQKSRLCRSLQDTPMSVEKVLRLSGVTRKFLLRHMGCRVISVSPFTRKISLFMRVFYVI